MKSQAIDILSYSRWVSIQINLQIFLRKIIKFNEQIDWMKIDEFIPDIGKNHTSNTNSNRNVTFDWLLFAIK